MTRRVSVVVPCRNEAGFIDSFLDDVLRQALPASWTMQVLVADGRSDDGTHARLAARAAAEPRLQVIDNPQGIVSTGLNRALEAATGEIVVRMDVHTRYAPDYVAACIATLARTGADCVGGAWRTEGDGPVARAFRSRLGSGGAASRRERHEGEVDTVYLGAWPRATLKALGGFDERLVRNQDDELALRIVRGGGRVWQSAAIRSWYRPRDSLRALWRQFWQYGYWKVAVIRKHRLPASPRHLAPVAFVAGLAVLAAAGLFLPVAAAAFGAVATAYAVVLLVAAAAAGPWRGIRCWGLTGAAIGSMHLAYGTGFARALWDHVRRRGAADPRSTRLTR